MGHKNLSTLIIIERLLYSNCNRKIFYQNFSRFLDTKNESCPKIQTIFLLEAAISET